MNEAQTKHDLITPALQDAGWDTAPAKIALEQVIAPGRVEHDGRSHRPEFADYVLMYGNRRLAVVEAKSDEKSVDAGEAQARHYAEALGVRFAYATNGRAVRSFDLVRGTHSDCNGLIFPTPSELLDLLKLTDDESQLEKRCREIPWAASGARAVRYYQERAVESVIRALGRGAQNALITLATGTGKTFIAYQLAHKLTQAKWTRQSLGLRKPRILFLADRNILADQAAESFVPPAFAPNECFRLTSGITNPPLDRTVYFTLYQTLLGRSDDEDLDAEAVREVKYRQFAPDFFDLIIVDECHRGGVNDESAWRVVLDYFRSAAHVGLTATPKCNDNGSTYAYFGKPVYEYSLKQGIADGFLSPYRVKRLDSTVTGWQYQPGDTVENGEELDLGKYYDNDELERNRIQIKQRDRHFIAELFKVMPADQKAIVFCVTQAHALRIAHIIREEAARRGIAAAHYCERVTAEDKAIGEDYLKQFRHNDNEIPTILTTSQKLTTGVDACNVRSIVLLKQVRNMIEFKQIIGRGTRIYEGKPHFTIYDFTDASERFNDPGWDGPVLCPKCGQNPCVCKRGGKHGGSGGDDGDGGRVCPVCGCLPCVCPKPERPTITVTLGEGRAIYGKWREKLFFDGKMLEVNDFLERFVTAVRKVATNPEALRECWADMNRRADFLDALARIGFDPETLREIQRGYDRADCDVLDVILDLAYAVTPITRELRAQFAAQGLDGMAPERQALARVILANYVKDGVWTLTGPSYIDLLKQRYGTLADAFAKLDFPVTPAAMEFYGGLQQRIYHN